MKQKSKNAVIESLRSSDSWTIISHVKPDGDTLGSASALFLLGEKLKKTVRWGGRDPFPDRYLFLARSEKYHQIESVQDLAQQDDLVITVDVSTIERGVDGLDAFYKVVNIDHHGDNNGFGFVSWIAPEASAVGEMIYSLAEDLGVIMDKEIAEALYVSIITDSGSMTYSNTTGDTCRIVGGLIDRGVKPEEITRLLYHNNSIERGHLWGRAYSRITSKGIVSYTWINKKDFIETGATNDDTEGLVNEVSRIKGTKISILFIENEEDIKVSFRSDCDYSVRDLASKWGGGGHVCASGCRISGLMDEVIDRVLRAI